MWKFKVSAEDLHLQAGLKMLGIIGAEQKWPQDPAEARQTLPSKNVQNGEFAQVNTCHDDVSTTTEASHENEAPGQGKPIQTIYSCEPLEELKLLFKNDSW